MSPFAAAARLIAIATWSGAAVLASTANGVAAPPGDSGTLMGMLPQGFSSANCQVATPTPPALEKVTCDQSSDPAGPAGAVFARYGNLNDLATGFQMASDKVVVASSCPGNQASPGTWTYGNSNQTAGQVECGTAKENNTEFAVIWTDNAKLRAAAVGGSDIGSLYKWWTHESG
jgi:hypothetical protein